MAGRLANPETGRHHHRNAAGDWYAHSLVAGPHRALAAPAGFGRGCTATGAATHDAGFLPADRYGPGWCPAWADGELRAGPPALYLRRPGAGVGYLFPALYRPAPANCFPDHQPEPAGYCPHLAGLVP